MHAHLICRAIFYEVATALALYNSDGIQYIVHCLYEVFMRSAVFNYPEISDIHFRVVEYIYMYIGLGLDIYTTVQYYTKQ